MSLKDKITISGLTDVGRLRDHNEDSICSNADLGLLVLADGMGGHKGGEVASAIAVDSITQDLARALPQIPHGKIDENTGYSLESMLVETAIKDANLKIYNAGLENNNYEGMGTTIVVLLFYDNRITIAHVGDSRLYRFRDDTLEQLTRDHTLLQELVDRGFYSKKEALESLNKNLITRAVGANATIDVDLLEDITQVGDRYLLCSDGLTDMINDDLITDIILDHYNDQNKMNEELIKQANEHGGKDNISAMLAQVNKEYPTNPSWINKIIDIFSH